MPTIEQIATAYRCTRQNVHLVSRRYGFTAEDWLEPTTILEALIMRGNFCPMREHLANPITQDWIRHCLKNPESQNP